MRDRVPAGSGPCFESPPGARRAPPAKPAPDRRAANAPRYVHRSRRRRKCKFSCRCEAGMVRLPDPLLQFHFSRVNIACAIIWQDQIIPRTRFARAKPAILAEAAVQDARRKRAGKCGAEDGAYRHALLLLDPNAGTIGARVVAPLWRCRLFAVSRGGRMLVP